MPSIIGEKIKARSNSSRSLPVSGHIRSGTQVLIKSAENVSKAKELYQKAASGVISFKDAEKLILEMNNGLKKVFTPKNTRHFNVYAHETEGGQVSVNNIMARHGEMLDGDTVPRLYRFPMVFPPTPAGVEGFFKSEYSMAVGAVKYRSEYGDDGIRRCVYLKPVDLQEQAKRKKFLRRDPTIRKDCDPASCAEFGAGACKFRGRIHFYIPDVIGSGTFVFETGSVNACEDIFLRLEELQRSVGGILPNFDPQGNPVFFLTKEQKKVSYIDNGVEKSSLQWVPVLQTSLIKSNILLLEEKKRLQLAAPAPVPSTGSIPVGWAGASFGQTLDAQADNEQYDGNNSAFNSENITDISSVVEFTAASLHKPASHPDRDHPASRPAARVVQPGGAAVSSKPQVAERIGEGRAVILGRLTPGQVRTEEDALEELKFIEAIHGLEIHDFAVAKYGEGWDEGECLMDLYKEVVELVTTSGSIDNARTFIPLLTLLNANRIPVKTLAFPYLKAFFGEFKKRHVPEALDHITELLKTGSVVAIAHMKAKLQKAA